MSRQSRFSPEVRERAVRLVREHEHPAEFEALYSHDQSTQVAEVALT